MTQDFKPNIIIFCCTWCAYAGADLAGVSRLQVMPHFRIIRTLCSGRVDPEFILHAFSRGADGIIVAGCHPGDCHYISGNYRTRMRMKLLKKTLEQLGMEADRFQLEWISASEGDRFVTVVNNFINRIIELGPNPLGVNSKEEVSVK